MSVCDCKQGHAAYCAAKFAVRGFTESLMTEMNVKAPHVKVACIHPGGVRTEIVNNALIKDESRRTANNVFEQKGVLSALQVGFFYIFLSASSLKFI